MKHRLTTIFLGFLIVTALFTSCASTQENYASSATRGTEGSGTSAEVLTVYLDAATHGFMEVLLDQFALEHPEIPIHVIDHSDMAMTDFSEKLAGELMTGGGPDVILALNVGTTNNILSNMTKLLENGNFLNIDALALDLSACHPAVLAAGKYKGEQYLLPLNYSLGFMLTTKERLLAYDVAANGDLPTFAGSLQKLYQHGAFAFPHYLTMQELYAIGGFSLIDYDNKTLYSSKSDILSLQKAADAYLSLFPTIFEENNNLHYASTSVLADYRYSEREAFLAEHLLFFTQPGLQGYHQSLPYLNTLCATLAARGETPYILTIPTINGDAPAPMPHYQLAVNANTRNRAAVRDFLESAIGVEAQLFYATQSGIPINNNAVDIIERFYRGTLSANESYLFPAEHIYSEEILNTYFNTIKTMKHGVYFDTQTAAALFTVLREYAQGRTIEEAFSTARSRVEFYLSE